MILSYHHAAEQSENDQEPGLGKTRLSRDFVWLYETCLASAFIQAGLRSATQPPATRLIVSNARRKTLSHGSAPRLTYILLDWLATQMVTIRIVITPYGAPDRQTQHPLRVHCYVHRCGQARWPPKVSDFTILPTFIADLFLSTLLTMNFEHVFPADRVSRETFKQGKPST